MGEGAPDYVHLRQILARDALGNLVPVACDPSGRVILLPYGTQTVSQDDPIRTIQGSDGLDLYTIAVDAAGRLIMLPYGWDGATYRPLKVDDEGRMIGVMKGQADVKWGLRGWWKFIASEGTTIKDYSGYGNNGSALSGVAAEAKYEDGVIGQAIELDGVDDRIVCSTTNHITVPPFTFEAWIYPHTRHEGVILSKGDLNNECSFAWRLNNDGTLSLYGYDGAANVSVASIETYDAEEWTHVIVTVDVDWNVKFYFNGVYDCTQVLTATSPLASAESLNIGRLSYFATWFFDGLLDEVRMYDRVLSADEVSWRYANTNPVVGKPTRMIAVDSEGRMRVNIEDMPYKEQILINKFIKSTAAASTIQVESDPVPDGKIWVIGSCMLSHDTDNITTLKIGIKRGVGVYPFNETLGAGNNDNLTIHAPLYLKAGDKLWSFCYPVANNIYCWLRGNGYELDAG